MGFNNDGTSFLSKEFFWIRVLRKDVQPVPSILRSTTWARRGWAGKRERSDRVTTNSDTLGLLFLWHDEIIHGIRSGGGAAALGKRWPVHLLFSMPEACFSRRRWGSTALFCGLPYLLWWGDPAALGVLGVSGPTNSAAAGSCRSRFDGRLRLQSSRHTSSPSF